MPQDKPEDNKPETVDEADRLNIEEPLPYRETSLTRLEEVLEVLAQFPTFYHGTTRTNAPAVEADDICLNSEGVVYLTPDPMEAVYWARLMAPTHSTLYGDIGAVPIEDIVVYVVRTSDIDPGCAGVDYRSDPERNIVLYQPLAANIIKPYSFTPEEMELMHKKT